MNDHTPCRTPATSSLRQLAMACLVSLAAACGGGGGGGGSPPPPPPPPANQPPVASFSAATTVQAGAPLALNASASTDADNDPLIFTWDFGDGTRGGGALLAHVFAGAGNFTVTLTVADGRGGATTATRTVNVSAGPALGAPATTQALVSDGAGPLSGVAISVIGGSATATTGADGKANIAAGTDAPQQLKFSKAGYADQFKSINLAAGAAGAMIEVRMLAREAPLTLADAAAGGTLTGKDGAVVTIPPNALVDANGNPVTGAVLVNVTPVNVGANPGAFPGAFQGFQPTGVRGLIASYGTVEYVFTKNGAPVQLAPGRKATIEIPIYTSRNLNGSNVVAGATIPLWSLDERTGVWVQEGTGTVVANLASPSELALRAEVGHFSWWNCDQWLGSIPEESYNPNTRCCIRDVPGGPCKENSGDVCNVSGSPKQQNQTAMSLWVRSEDGAGGGNTGAIHALLRPHPGAARPPSPTDVGEGLLPSPASAGEGPGVRAEVASRPTGAQPLVRPFAVDPATRRIPATVATATVPALAGGVLPMPANLDIDVIASARNGTYRGTRTFRGGAGVSETVIVDLLPVAGGGNNDPITLPWDQVYSMAAAGEVDRYRLAMPVGAGFELRVAPSASQLIGTVRVTRPDASVVANMPFNASTTAYVAEQTVAAAGDYIIEITAGTGTPGAYRLDAASFGACSSTEALMTPSTPTINLGPNQSRCYDVTLAADDVIEATIGQISNGIAGSQSLATAGGVQTLVARDYPAGLSSIRRILTGVSVAGTYRLRATNRTLATGSFPLTITKPAVQVLAVPASTTIGDLAVSTPRLFLVKPPADGLFHIALGNTGGQVGAGSEPSLASFVIATAPSARAQRATAPVLPVVTVFRNSGAGTVTVSAGAPTLIARDTDVTGVAAAATPAVFAFDGNIGEPIAYGHAIPQTSTAPAGFGVFAPSGVQLGGNATVQTLAESGVFTTLVTALGGVDAPFTLRVNNAPAPVALTLTPPVTSQPVNLPLGQALRYTFDLAQADLVGLQLSTTGPLNVSAIIGGVDGAAVSTPTSGSGPFTVATQPRFVNTGANAMLTLRSTSTTLERASGAATVGIVRPTPTASSFNVPVNVTLAVNEWLSYRYAVPASGRTLLRMSTAAAAPYAFAGTVWAPSSIFTGYAGEFSSDASSFSVPTEGLGLLAAGNHTVTVRNGGQAAGAVTMTLVNLEDPVVLALGAANTAGTIDTDGERDYASFAALGGIEYTVRVTAAFNGTVRVRKLNANGDFTNRGFQADLGGTPLALANGVERVVSFTIPTAAPFGDGTYIIEIAGDAGATGGYTVRVASPN